MGHGQFGRSSSRLYTPDAYFLFAVSDQLLSLSSPNACLPFVAREADLSGHTGLRHPWMCTICWLYIALEILMLDLPYPFGPSVPSCGWLTLPSTAHGHNPTELSDSCSLFAPFSYLMAEDTMWPPSAHAWHNPVDLTLPGRLIANGAVQALERPHSFMSLPGDVV